MSRVRRCPSCGEVMVESLQRLAKDAVYGDEAWWANKTAGWVIAYSCPRQSEHGKAVACDNCGRDARSPREHYSFTPGLLGSGKWSCISKQQQDNIAQTLTKHAINKALEPKPAAQPRPHFFKGNLHDDKCARCGLPQWRTDDVHGDDAIQAALDRLYGLEDYLARP